MSGRSPPLYCTLTLITMHSHQSYPNLTTVIHSYEYSPTIDLLTHKDDGLPLVIDELVGVSSLKVVDELDEVAVTLLAMVLVAQVRQLTLALDVVDADLALHQFLHKNKTPQRNMFCARNVDIAAGDVQRRRVIDVQRHAAKALTEAQLRHHVGAEYRLLLHCQSRHHELCLHRGLCGQPL